MVAEDLEVEFVEEGLQETFERVRSNPNSIRETFKDHKRFLG